MHLFSGAACNPGVAHPARRGLGWAHRPSCIPGGAQAWRAGLAWPTRRGGRTVPPLANAGGALGVGLVSRAEEGWAVCAVPPLACVGGAGLDAPSVLLRTRAGRGAWGWVGVARAEGWAHRPSSRECGRGTWGWAGVTRAEEGWVVCAVLPLACVGGAGLDAPSVLLRTRAGRGAWGWASVARAEGWAHHPSSRVCGRSGAGQASPAPKGTGVGTLSSVRRQGGAGATCPRAHPFRANGADVRKGGAGGRQARANVVTQTRGKRTRAPYACEGAAAVNAGDGVGERLTIVHGGARCKGWGRGGRGGREEWSRGDLILTELGSEGEGEGTAYIRHRVQNWTHPCQFWHQFTPSPPASRLPHLPLPPSPASRAAVHYGKSLTHSVPRIDRRRPFARIRHARALPPCLGHHVRAGPPPPGPSLPNICPIRAERVRTRARRPGPSLPAHGGQRAHPGPLRRRRRLPRPAPPAYARGGTVRPPLRAGHASPTPRAPPCPRTQEDGRGVQPRPAHARKGKDGAHNPALLGAGDTSPAPRAPPAFARGGTVRPPLRAGHANPTPRAPPCPHMQEDGRRVQPRPAHARKGRDGAHSPALLDAGHQPNPKRPARIRERRDGAPTPPRGPRQSSRPRTQGGGSGCKRVGAPSLAPSARGVLPPGYTPRPRRGACKGEGCTHAREGATRNEGRCNPSASGGVARRVCGRCGAERNPGGGAAHEWKDTHIGARVRKGESDGEGVVNEAKRSRGEAARANGGHPAPVDRLRKIHVK
ncbi:hypothetical protein EDB83DRAFT_2321678 [Lactarius deliciosus]|nr:hypothetical protein EDB83DRAFT_2321678 [Lactarius deliciosus]